MSPGAFYVRFSGRLSEAIDGLLSGERWKAKALAAVVALALFRAFPSYDALDSDFVDQTWRHAEAKFDNPLADSGRIFPPEWHESNLAFRLTAPVLAHVLGLRRTGMLIASGIGGLVLLFSVLRVSYSIIPNKRVALFVCLATACAWPGAAAYHELRGGYYDATALCLLLLGLSTASAFLTGLWVFLAAWTDERALIASLFLFLFWIRKDYLQLRWSRPGKLAAILTAWAGYLALRLYLTANHVFVKLTGTGIGLSTLARQVNIVPIGIWTGLGGGWIIVAAGFIALLLEKRYLMAAA